MNLNRSVESPIISMEQQLIPLSLTQESQEANVPQLEHTMRPTIQLPTSPIGESESNPILNPLERVSQPKSAISSVSQLSNLRSNVKPHVLLEKAPEVRVLKVSKADIAALCQVINEFQEQFSAF